MSIFDVLFYSFFSSFFFFVEAIVSNGSLNFLNMRSYGFFYRDILCIVGNILILIPFVDAIFFFFFPFPPSVNVSRMILEISRS